MSVLNQMFRRVMGSDSPEPAHNFPIPVQAGDMGAVTRSHSPLGIYAGETGGMQSSLDRNMAMTRGQYAPQAGMSGGGGTLLFGSEPHHFEGPKSDSGARFLMTNNE